MNNSNIVKFPGKHKHATVLPAVYTFVFTTLIGPAIAAGLLGLIYLVSGVLHMGPPSIKTLPLAQLPAYTAERVLAGYVWSAIPAVLTAAALAALVWRTATFHWLHGVMIAAVAATFMAVMSGGVAADHSYFIASIAAVAAILGRMVLVATKVVE